MEQTIFNNILLLLIIIFIIKLVSPETNSLLFILQKYLNYFIYHITRLFYNNEGFNNVFNGSTFNGIPQFALKAPTFKTSYEIAFVNFYKDKNPNINESDIYKLYHFLQLLINIDTDNYFLTPSDKTANTFTLIEQDKIKNILLNKLNKSNFNFTNFNYEFIPEYYLNFSGKEVNPFVFTCDTTIGKLRIYINIDIRNDVYQNKEYLVINEIKPLKDKQVIFNSQNNEYVSSQNNQFISNLTNVKLDTFLGNDSMFLYNSEIDNTHTYNKIDTNQNYNDIDNNYNYIIEDNYNSGEPINYNSSNVNSQINYNSNEQINYNATDNQINYNSSNQIYNSQINYSNDNQIDSQINYSNDNSQINYSNDNSQINYSNDNSQINYSNNNIDNSIDSQINNQINNSQINYSIDSQINYSIDSQINYA